jgi:hypothetical protein
LNAPQNPTTIKEQWDYYNKRCMHGNAPRHGFELMYYLGAGAYQNILVESIKDADADKASKILESLTEEIQKRLDELTA